MSELVEDLLAGAVKQLATPIGKIPTYGGTDLKASTEALRAAALTNQGTKTVIDQSQIDFSSATAREKAALDAEAQALGDSARADQERAQQVANVTLVIGEEVFGKGEIAKNAGVLAGELMRRRPVLDARLSEITALSSPSNPLDWLTNQFILPSKVEAYNAEATAYNALQNSLDSAIATSNAIDDFAKKGIPTVTAAKAKAVADDAVAKAGIKKAQADEQLAKTNVEFAVRKLAGDMSIANMTNDMTRMQQTENTQRYQSQINAINIAQNQAERLVKAAQLLETIKETRALDVVLKNYDRAMGHPEGTTNKYTFKSTPAVRQQDIIAIGSGSMGSDPFTGMMTFYANRPGPGVSQESQRLFAWLKDRATTLEKSQAIQGLDEKQKPSVIGGKLKEQLIIEIENASKPGNLFYELSPQAMLASTKVPAGSPLVPVLEPLTKAPGVVPTTVILSTIGQAFKNPAEAGAAAAAYYQANIDARNTATNTSLIGVKLPNSYIIQETIGSFGFGKLNLDLTKPEDATKWFVLQKQKQAAAARGSFTSSGGNVPSGGNILPFELPNVRSDIERSQK